MLSDFLFLHILTKTNIMNKRVFLFVLAILLFNLINAQTQFDNASFEEWEEIGFGPNIIEPVEWSSIKSSDDETISGQAPHVWDRSEPGNAHTGNYSVYLHTVRVFGINATGTLANGRYHAEFNINNAYTFTDTVNSQWHTRITARPDSLVGWYKAKPSTGDFPTVKCVLHTGYAAISAISDTSSFVASNVISLPSEEVTEWTRFSFPLIYHKDILPEYALVILTSSNGLSAIEGSEAWFDDLEFIYNDGTGIIEKDSDELDIIKRNNGISVFVNTSNTENYSLTVYDMMGRLVKKDNGFTGQKNMHDLNISKGTYIVSVSYAGKTLTKKIIF
jgi:hypothetical protein